MIFKPGTTYELNLPVRLGGFDLTDKEDNNVNG